MFGTGGAGEQGKFPHAYSPFLIGSNLGLEMEEEGWSRETQPPLLCPIPLAFRMASLSGLVPQKRPTELFRDYAVQASVPPSICSPRVMEGVCCVFGGALESSPDFVCVFVQVVAGCGTWGSH